MTDKEIELQAKIDWLELEIEDLAEKNRSLAEALRFSSESRINATEERKAILKDIAEALHQIHEGKTGNAIQILNHLAIL